MQSFVFNLARWLARRLGLERAPRPVGSGESGQALIETAMLVPVLIVLLVGSVDCGRFMYDGILTANAVQAGAQYGAQTLTTTPDTVGMQAAATADAQNIAFTTPPAASYACFCIDTGGDQTAANCFVSNSCTGATHRIVYAVVTTTSVFQPLLGYPGLPGALTISSTAQRQVSP